MYFSGQDSKQDLADETVTVKRLSAFDGEKTTSIEYGNSVNIHERRYEPSQLFPPHCWGMLQTEVNFPLSIYLAGTEAMKNHPKVRRYPQEYGLAHEFYRVECEFDKEEVVGELNCFKIRCRPWHRSNGAFTTQFLWLAPERNYLCVKSKTLPLNGIEEFPLNESVVEEFEQIAPDLWLPGKVVIKEYDYQAARKQEAKLRFTRSQTLEKAVYKPQHPPELFQNVEVPEELPLFTIRADGRLKNGALANPLPPTDQGELKKLLEKLRAEEELCKHHEIELETEYYRYGSGSRGLTKQITSIQKSARIDELARFSEKKTFLGMSGAEVQAGGCGEEQFQPVMQKTSVSETVQACDGLWLRIFDHYYDVKPKGTDNKYAFLYRDAEKRLRVIRPHILFFRMLNIYTPLSHVMSSETWAQDESSPLSAVYEGKETIDTFDCHRVRIDVFSPNRPKPYIVAYLWLAEERNYLPVRYEFYESKRSEALPTSIGEVLEFKEISPGVWCPTRLKMLVCNRLARSGLCENRLIVSYRHDYKVTRVKLDPVVDPKLFEQITVPAGTNVTVYDENGELTKSYKQQKTGNIQPPPVK